jgi:hypothetical protein
MINHQPPAAPAQDVTEGVLINVILDRSGSMLDCRASTISGYNEYLQGLRGDKDSNYNVSLIQFDSPDNEPELTVSYADKPLSDVGELTEAGYQPRGMTPLYDAIGECVRRVDAKKRAVITVIITDGHENASREFSRLAIQKLIGEKKSGGWKFIFLGANIDSAAVGSSMGIPVTDCANYAPTNEGVACMFQSVASSNMRYTATARSAGLNAAASLASFTTAEHASMMGGRPAAPPSFRLSPRPSVTAVSTGNISPADAAGRTKWTVRSEISGS